MKIELGSVNYLISGDVVRFFIFIPILFMTFSVLSSEFNTSFLQGEALSSHHIDQLLDEYNKIPLGRQNINLVINRKPMGYVLLTIIEDSQGQRVPCLDKQQQQKFGIYLNKRGEEQQVKTHCQAFFRQLESEVTYDSSNVLLKITIPSQYLKSEQQIDYDQRNFNQGINSAFINYSLSARYSSQQQDNMILPAYADIGLNLSDWRIRTRFSGSDLLRDEVDFQQMYAAKPILKTAGEVVIGESLTQGVLIDSIPYLGFSFRSDSEMLPQYKQHYSPLIQGVAESNSTVNIYQGNYLIYTK